MQSVQSVNTGYSIVRCWDLDCLLIQMNLKWPGHVERMDHQRLLRQLLHSQLCEGKRNQGRPRLRFKDTVKRNLKKLDIDKSSWQRKVKDRAAWRNLNETVIVAPDKLQWLWWSLNNELTYLKYMGKNQSIGNWWRWLPRFKVTMVWKIRFVTFHFIWVVIFAAKHDMT